MLADSSRAAQIFAAAHSAMADPRAGWQTVMPTSHAGIERLSRAHLEAYERQILKEWETSRGSWSGV